MLTSFKARLPLAGVLMTSAALAIGAAAMADSTDTDADADTAGIQNAQQALGTLQAGEQVTRHASFFLKCSGRQHVDNGRTVTFSPDAGGSGIYPAGSTTASAEGAVGATSAQITVPAAWTDDGNSCGSTPPADLASTVSTVTITAPSTPGDYEVIAAYSAAATANDSGLTGNVQSVKFSLTVAAPPAPTDTTPPVIDYDLDGTVGDNGWFTSDVDLTWSVTDAESTAVPTGCVDQHITADQDATDYSCEATSDGGTAGPVTVSIKRDATKPVNTVTGVSAQNYVIGTDTIPSPGCSTTDNLSGVATSSTLAVTGGPVGAISAKCSGGSDNAGNLAADATTAYSVLYGFVGFFRPIDPGSTLNSVRAGSAVPVKFSLDGTPVAGSNTPGDGGATSVVASGSPSSATMACSSTADVDAVEETSTAGSSSLKYDAAADQWIYVWKTEKGWAGTCRQLVVKLADGTYHRANFKITK